MRKGSRGGGKGKASQTVNKIDNLNVEIDYDKLAKAVTDAILSAEQKKCTEKSDTSNIFALLTSLIFRIFGIIGIVISIACIVGTIVAVTQQSPSEQSVENIVASVIVDFIALVIILISWMMLRSAKELENERDKQFIVSVFSAIVSFSALVVALVALYK